MKTPYLLAVLALPVLCHASDAYRTDAHVHHNPNGEITLTSQPVMPSTPQKTQKSALKAPRNKTTSDLTTTYPLPTPQDNASEKSLDTPRHPAKAAVSPLTQPPKPITFFVSAHEAPFRALTRWVEKKGYRKVAYALSDQEQAALLTPVETKLNFTGDLKQAIHELGQTIGLPLKFELQRGIAAVHTQNGLIEVHWVHGASLKAVVKNLAREYRWRWQPASWMSGEDYPLMSEYGIVTPRNGFDVALDIVLDGYPVQAQLIPSSHTLFIRNRQ